MIFVPSWMGPLSAGEDHAMATKASRSTARIMMAPAVVLLLGWMLVPLIMTLWFSFKRYLPLRGDSLERGLDGSDLTNYSRLFLRVLSGPVSKPH